MAAKRISFFLALILAFAFCAQAREKRIGPIDKSSNLSFRNGFDRVGTLEQEAVLSAYVGGTRVDTRLMTLRFDVYDTGVEYLLSLTQAHGVERGDTLFGDLSKIERLTPTSDPKWSFAPDQTRRLVVQSVRNEDSRPLPPPPASVHISLSEVQKRELERLNSTPELRWTASDYETYNAIVRAIENPERK